MIIKNKWLPVFFCHVLCLTAIEAVALIQNPIRCLAVYCLLSAAFWESFMCQGTSSDWFGTVYTWSKSVSHTNRAPHIEHTGNFDSNRGWCCHTNSMVLISIETLFLVAKVPCKIRMNPALMNNDWIITWMNKMNEWMTEWTNPACMNECINEWMDEWTMHEWMNFRMNK